MTENRQLAPFNLSVVAKMDWSIIAGFAAMAVVIEISPGPNFLLITRSVPTYGMRGALANFTGFACSYLFHGTLAIYGISAILATEPILLLLIQLSGACYLLYLGIKSLASQRWFKSSLKIIKQPVDILLTPASAYLATVSNVSSTNGKVKFSFVTNGSVSGNGIDIILDEESIPITNGGLFTCFREGLVTSVLNPKITLFYMAAFPQFILADSDTVTSSFLLVFIHATISSLWTILVALVLIYALKKANSQLLVSKLNNASGVALIGLSLAFFFSAARVV